MGNPMTEMNIVDDMATAITRLRFLEKQSVDDREMITLLQKQKNELAQELADLQHNTGVDMFKVMQERDEALRQVKDVQNIIDTLGAQALALGNLALAGTRRIRGDEVGDSSGQSAASHDPRLPPPQVDDPRLPRLERLPIQADNPGLGDYRDPSPVRRLK